MTDRPAGVLRDALEAEAQGVLDRRRLVGGRGGGLEQLDEGGLLLQRQLGFFALGDVAPGLDHLDGLSAQIPQEALLVPDPAIGAVRVLEPVLDDVVPVGEQARELGEHAVAVVGMKPLQPEFRPGQVIARLVAQEIAHVLADEGRRVPAADLEAADHRRGRGEQVGQPPLRRLEHLLGALDLGHVGVDGDDAAVVGLALVDLDPAAVDALLEKRASRRAVVGDPLGKPALDGHAVRANDAGLGDGAGDGLESYARHDDRRQAGMEILEVPVA